MPSQAWLMLEILAVMFWAADMGQVAGVASVHGDPDGRNDAETSVG